MSTLQKRIEWIDYARFIGIFLVVLGHTHLPINAVNTIYSFHMPLFFFISGLLFDLKKHPSFSDFVKHRFKQLIIPYFFFNLITLLFWFFVGRKFGRDATEEIPLIQPLFGIFYGVDSGHYLIHCGSLWFLPCLFFTELLFYIGAKYLNRIVLLVLCALIGYANYLIHHVMLPFSFDVALVALMFYAVGNTSADVAKKNLKLNVAFVLPGLLIFSAALVYLATINQRVDMSSNTYPNYFMFIVTAIMGILATFSLAMFLSRLIGNNKIISYFAMSTLIILALHEIAGSLLKGLLFFIFKIPVSVFEQSIGLNILLTLFSFISLAPVIYLINRYVPFIPGYKVKHAQ